MVFLVLTPLVLAGNYGEGIYGSGNYSNSSTSSLFCGDGICNNGESCSTCSADCGTCPITSSSGGGGSGGSSCTYDWQCKEWFPSICPESGIQKRICANKGDCTGTKGMPNQARNCEYFGPSEPLFDISLTLENNSKKMCSGNKIKANVKLENYAKVELLDAFMTYWILDENSKLIVEYKDTRAVVKKTNFDVELKVPESTPKGTYRAYAEITYSGNRTAVTGESFKVLSKEECALLPEKNFNWMYLVYGIVGIFFVLLVLILIKSFKKFRITKRKTGIDAIIKEGEENLKRGRLDESKKRYFLLKNLYKSYYGDKRFIHKKIMDYYNLLVKNMKNNQVVLLILGFGLTVVFLSTRNSMTGFVVGITNAINNRWSVFGFILIIGMLGLLIFTSRKKIVEKIEIRKRNKFPKNSLKGLIKKKVYCGEGNYIGKVDEVLIEENKIDSLRIKLDKKQKSKIKGITVKYKDIKCVGHIVIINEKVLKKLNIQIKNS